MYLFHKRTFWLNFEDHVKQKPSETELWIGQNNANYGLFVSPRFSNGRWENDKSEIHKFKKKYWSIGHVLKTGLVIPLKNKQIKFSNLTEFLDFYCNVFVRQTGSTHQMKIAELYSEYVKSQKNLKIP